MPSYNRPIKTGECPVPPLSAPLPPSGTPHAVRLFELREEVPGALRGKYLAVVRLRRVMVALVDDPLDRIAFLAAFVVGLDRGRAWLRLRRQGCAAIIFDKSIANLAAHSHIEYRVRGAVLAVVGNRLSAVSTSGERGAREDSYSAEDVGTGAGQRVGHSPAVAETCREDQARIDTHILRDRLEHSIEE